MNRLIALLLIVVTFSCNKEEDSYSKIDCLSKTYDSSFDIQQYDEVCFPDGNSFVLEDITYALCPCDVNCFWEGEMRLKLFTKSANEPLDSLEISTSPLFQSRTIFEEYTVSSLEFRYINGHQPCDVEDFEPENTIFMMTIVKE